MRTPRYSVHFNWLNSVLITGSSTVLIRGSSTVLIRGVLITGSSTVLIRGVLISGVLIRGGGSSVFLSTVGMSSSTG